MPKNRPPLALVGLPLLAYGSAARFGFVYDDHWTLVHNPSLERPLGALMRSLAALDPTVPDVSRPAMVLLHWLERRAFGLGSAWGYHTVSLGLHVACTLLAWRLAFLLVRRRAVALGAAALWSALPVHAEVVAAINYREDLLATAGVLGVALLLLAPTSSSHGWGRAACASAALALGLAAKESAMVVLLLVPALAPAERSWWRRRERSLVASLAVIGAYLMWRLGSPEDLVPRASSTLAEASWAMPGYLAWTVVRSLLPFGSTPLYEPLSLPSVAVVGCALAWVAALGVASRHRGHAAGAAGLLLLLAPVATSPWVGPINARADRYVYLASLGAALLIAWSAHAGLRRVGARGHSSTPRRWLPLLTGAALLAMAVASARASSTWRDDLELWTEGVRRAPTSAKAWAALGWARRRAGDHDGSERALRRSLALEPDRAATWVVLGGLELARGNRERAEEIARRLGQAEPAPVGAERLRRCLRASAPARCLGDEGPSR